MSPVIDPVTGAFTYTPDADVNGSDTFTFVVTDGARQSNQPIVTVTIVEANDPPVAARTPGRKWGPEKGTEKGLAQPFVRQ